MKKSILLLLAILSIAFYSCKENARNTDPEVVSVDNSESSRKTHELPEGNAQFKNPQTEAVYQQYMEVEKALVNSDATKTAQAAKELQKMIPEVDDDPSTMKALDAMANTDDIEKQRLNFVALNTAMEDILQGSLKNGTIYKQYCPMAFNNTGAYWFSSSKEIYNPYFGDKMLKCGRVDAEIE